LPTDPFHTLLLPVETLSRELDAKLLTACVAAEAGFRIILGSKRDLHMRIERLPPSIYMGKSLSSSNHALYQRLHDLGCVVVSGDEEALVYYSPESYRKAKLSPDTIREVDLLLAWGAENESLWRGYSGYGGAPIRVTGNPRTDLLRPELRAYWSEDVQTLKQRYGDFLLLNSNFGKVNHYRADRSVQLRVLEQASRGTKPASDFDLRLAEHRLAMFEDFRKLAPALAEAFPNHTLVIRPHPSESHASWRSLTSGNANVEVVHEGNVIPWLLGADAMIHNGCTTAIESWLLDKPAIAFRPVSSESLDLQLPNDLSFQAASISAVISSIQDALKGVLVPERRAEQEALVDRYISGVDGPLSSEQVVSELSQLAGDHSIAPRRRLSRLVALSVSGSLKRAKSRVKPWIRGAEHRKRYRYHDHIFPDIPVQYLEARVRKLQQVLGRFSDIRVRGLRRKIFEITSAHG
jgi:surface carbohydrate biosynthesis protein